MSPLLGFLARTGAPFLVNAYPYFAYKADPDRVDLGYALFEPNAAGVADAATGLRYDNMLHAMVDAARAAICSEQGEEQAAAVRGKLGGGVRRPGHGVRTLLVSWERTEKIEITDCAEEDSM
ncbi:glucan endo-1,3-beta-glucosidase 11-like [Miscanthus floridulus]|uniref:glucan endo-1,3-beta-glucosidase 11-like n=1 Tax=Miscanthus floridulus TaxID=154761 RepID=UPI0034575807